MKRSTVIGAVVHTGTGSMSSFETQFNACYDLTEIPWNSSQCPPGRFLIEDKREVEIDTTGPPPAYGGVARVVYSRDSSFVVKTPNKDAVEYGLLMYQEEVCREKVLLEYMNTRPELSTVVPKIFVPAIDPSCERSVIVSENVGVFTLSDLRTSDGNILAGNPIVFDIGIRILEMIQALHANGISHGDPHAGNIVFADAKNLVRSLRFVDFGLSGFIEANFREIWMDVLTAIREIRDLLSSSGFDVKDGPAFKEIVDISCRVGDPCTTRFPDYRAAIQELRIARDLIAMPPAIPTFPVRTEKIKWDIVDTMHEILNTKLSLAAYLDLLVQSRKLSKDTCLSSLRSAKINGRSVKSVFHGLEDVSVRSGRHLIRVRFVPAANWPAAARNSRIEEALGFAVFKITDWGQIPNECRPFLFVSREPQRPEFSGIVAYAQNALRLLERIHDTGIVVGRRIEISDWDGELVVENLGSARMYVNTQREYLSPNRKCKLHRLFSEVASPGDVLELCPTRFDDLYSLSELLMSWFAGDVGHPDSGDSVEAQLDFQRNLADLPGVPEVLKSFHLEMFARSAGRTIGRPDYQYWIERFLEL